MYVRHLKVFADLVGTGSYTTAAKLNGITQSAVSQQVASLEADTRLKLVEQSGKALSLTDAGRIVYETAKEVRPLYLSFTSEFQVEPPRIQFDALRMFTGVAKTKNFTLTAQKAGVTQSAVSQQIKSLESQFRAPLFDRSNLFNRDKNLPLTAVGERLSATATMILRAHDSMQRLLKVPQPDPIETERDHDEVAFELFEGTRITVTHIRRERRRELVAAKKSDFIEEHGRLFCEACQSDFNMIYGETNRAVFEVHHRRMLSVSGDKGIITSLRDLAVLCANCHSVIHFSDPLLTVEELSLFLRNQIQTGAKST